MRLWNAHVDNIGGRDVLPTLAHEHRAKGGGTTSPPFCTPTHNGGTVSPPLCIAAQVEGTGSPPLCVVAEGRGRLPYPCAH